MTRSDVTSVGAALIGDQLLQLIEGDRSIISSRASVSIDSWLDSASAPSVAKLLNHSNDTAGHNLLAWLTRRVDAAELRPLRASVLIPDKMESAIANADKCARCRDADVTFTRASAYLFSYVPNLSDCREDAASG
jgi:hypothetical protein